MGTALRTLNRDDNVCDTGVRDNVGNMDSGLCSSLTFETHNISAEVVWNFLLTDTTD